MLLPRATASAGTLNHMEPYGDALEHAHRRTLDWLASLSDRPVPPQASIEEVTQALGTSLPDGPTDAGRRSSTCWPTRASRV